jgi:Mg-chelatase subunit ChlD
VNGSRTTALASPGAALHFVPRRVRQGPHTHPTMPVTHSRARAVRLALSGLAAFLSLASCEAAPGGGRDTAAAPVVTPTARYKSSVDEGLGVSVAIVLDNSGSMKDRAPGDTRPKADVARAAVERTLDATDAALVERPDYPVKVGLILFSSTARTVLAMQPYNRDSIRAAIARLPAPDGGTAIGDAMQVATRALYRAGTFRKVMLVVTDGENNAGAEPVDVAHEIHARSEGGVGMYFVAFDTDPKKFGFLRGVKGDVVAAQNGDALQTALAELYQGKVLVESQTEPDVSSPAADASVGPHRATPRRSTSPSIPQ